MTTCGYDYNTLLIFQERDGRNNEALQTLEALQKVVVAECMPTMQLYCPGWED